MSNLRGGALVAATLLGVASGLPMAASAAPANCGARTDLVEELAKRYSEAPVAIGLASDGTLVEVLTEGSGATWTIIVNLPNGMSCLVASGESWQELKRVAANDPQV